MRYFQHFTYAHLWILLVLLAVFAACNYAIMVAAGAETHTVVLTTLGTVLGPFTGAVARHWQSCCTEFSLSLVPFCGGVLAACTLLQLIRIPGLTNLTVRLAVWTTGWLVWFLGGFVSFGHALE